MRLTTAKRIDLREIIKTGTAADMALYLVSRLIDEESENRAHDHWHPEIAELFGEMSDAWIEAIDAAGVEVEYRKALPNRPTG